MIDLDALEASIAEGEKKNFFVAPVVKELIAELRELRAKVADCEQSSEQSERPSVVAWLRALTVEWSPGTVAYAIERGEHRREEEG